MKTRLFVLLLSTLSAAQPIDLAQDFNLGGQRSMERHYFHIQNNYIKYQQNGERAVRESYSVLLSCEPGEHGDTCTCHRFIIKLDEMENAIPELENWTYLFNPGEDGLDEHGQVLSIPHDKFANLTTTDGTPINEEHRYAIYNSFIDFHGFNIFVNSMQDGSGIEDLHRIGDKIVHDAAYSEPPVNLGSAIKEGSVFRNGEVTLTLKGISKINDKICALVGFDSGESSFSMKMEPMPNMLVNTDGSSHYFGDLYVDLDSHWLQRADMAEFVVSETLIPSMNNMKIPGIVERRVAILNVPYDEFTKLLSH